MLYDSSHNYSTTIDGIVRYLNSDLSFGTQELRNATICNVNITPFIIGK